MNIIAIVILQFYFNSHIQKDKLLVNPTRYNKAIYFSILQKSSQNIRISILNI